MLTKNRALIYLAPILANLCLLLLGVSLAWGIYYSLDWTLNTDAANMHYIAWRIMGGAVPYRDIFEHDLPGTYILHMLCITIFGRSDLAFRLFDLFFCALAAAGYLALGWNRNWRFAFAGASFFILYHLAEGPQDMAQRDFLMVPFILFSLAALRAFMAAPQCPIPLFIFGVLTGYAFCIKPTIGMLVLMSVIVLMVKIQPMPQKIKALAIIAAGMMLPIGCILAWLYSMPGALPALWDIVLHFWPVYAHYQPFDANRAAIFMVTGLLYFGGPMLYIAGYSRTSIPPADKTLLLLAIAYGIFHFLSQGNYFTYHNYPVLAAMAIYPIWVVPIIKGAWWERIFLHLNPLLLILYLSPLGALSRYNMEHYPSYIPDKNLTLLVQMKADADEALRHIPADIRNAYLLQRPNGAIACIGTARGQLFNAAYRYGWVSPVRQFYPFAMYGTQGSDYMDERAKASFHDFSAAKPLVIMVSGESWPFNEHLVYSTIDIKPPWKDFFARNYVLTKETSGLASYRVYARIK